MHKKYNNVDRAIQRIRPNISVHTNKLDDIIISFFGVNVEVASIISKNEYAPILSDTV